MTTIYSGVSNHWRAYLDYSTSTSNTAVTITAKGGFGSYGWGFSINPVTCTLSCTGKSSVSGSGAVSIGTGATVNVQLASTTFTVNRTTSAQSITLSAKTVNSTGYMNGTLTASTTINVPALPSYSVSYNANGGSGAPSSQTKWYGKALTLSSTKPTRSGYNFLGWATSASATSPSYQPGASYTGNAALALYAVWAVAYIAPSITGFNAYRCTSAGAANSEGTYFRVAGSWSVNTSINSSNKASSVKVEYKPTDGSTWTTAETVSVSATSGTLPTTAYGGGNIATGTAYDVRVTVTDTGGSGYVTTVVSKAHFIMHVSSDGTGVSFGEAATPGQFSIASEAFLYNSGSVLGGHILYSNADGNTGTVTLAESSADFQFIDIDYSTNDNVFCSVRLWGPNGRSVICAATPALNSTVSTATTTSVFIKTRTYTVSGTTVTPKFKGMEGAIKGSNTCSLTDNTNYHFIKIHYIVGYR